MTDDELIEQLVASAPRPSRDQITRLALLLAGASGTGDDAEEDGACAA